MEKLNSDKKKMYLCELSGSKFHSVTSSNAILYTMMLKTKFSSIVDLTRFGNKLLIYGTPK